MSVAQHQSKEGMSRHRFGPACIGPTFETEYILNWVDIITDSSITTTARPHASELAYSVPQSHNGPA